MGKFGTFRLLLCIPLLLAGLVSAAATITVTSIADDGSPGTLRYALLLAKSNGDATPDEIVFNIPGTSSALHTIYLLSALPELSSNLTIDGTTQPGERFGLSDAAIRIVLPQGKSILVGLRGIGLTTINIYGLFIDKPAVQSGTDDVPAADDKGPAGIQVRNSKNVQVGGPGKGNIVRNMYHDIDVGFESMGGINDLNDESLLSENVKVQNNIVGLDPAGTTRASLRFSFIYANRVRNLLIQDNLIAGKIFYTDISNNTTFKLGKLQVKNNVVGLNAAGTDAIETFPFTSVDECVNISSALLGECEVNGNVLSGRSTGLTLSVNCFFKVQGNRFGTSKDGSTIIGLAHSAIILKECKAGGLIGGPSAAEGNTIQGCFSHTYPGSESIGVIRNENTAKVELDHNAFRCNGNNYSYQADATGAGLPKVDVALVRDQNVKVSGTATPGATVSLFYSRGCRFCEPEEFFKSVVADANGNWTYSATLQNYNIIANATLNGTSSEFSSVKADYQPSNLKIVMACGTQKGSITGISYKNALGYHWYKNGVDFAYTKDISNLDAGTYYLVVTDGFCNAQTDNFIITDVAVTASTNNMVIKPATCNLKDGSITGIVTNGNQFEWRDSKNAIVASSTTTADLLNVGTGLYTLTVATTGYCSKTFGPFNVFTPGNPAFDYGNQQVIHALCDAGVGAINGVRVSGPGTYTYTWYNSKNLALAVSSSADLVGVPAGKYILQASGGSICGTISTPEIEIPQDGLIVLDETSVKITVAGCGGPGGSVTGIKQTGATNAQWVYTTNGTAAGPPGLDLVNVQPGTYRLLLSNATCSKSSADYTVVRASGTVFPVYKIMQLAPSCGTNSGSIEVLLGSGLQPSSLRWVNAAGTTVGTAPTVNGLDAGAYQLYFTDVYGCETLYGTYTLTRVPPLVLNNASVTVNPDRCSAGKGSVTGVVLSGGMPPYTYFWTDEAGKQVATTADLVSVKPGLYFFHAADAFGGPCNVVNTSYRIDDSQAMLDAPLANDVELCAAGQAKIVVPKQAPGMYRLYTDPAGSPPIRENTSGTFSVNVSKDTPFYIEYVSGTCTSARRTVWVRISDKGFRVSGSFTPNNDGVNDFWEINNIESYPNAEIKVFNRLGVPVFQSVGYAIPFDGRSRGTVLPAGTYYYIIDLHSNCKPMSGSLTLIR